MPTLRPLINKLRVERPRKEELRGQELHQCILCSPAGFEINATTGEKIWYGKPYPENMMVKDEGEWYCIPHYNWRLKSKQKVYKILGLFEEREERIDRITYPIMGITEAPAPVHVYFSGSSSEEIQVMYLITATATETTGNGTISPSGDVYVEDGEDQEFIITPEEDSYFELVVDGETVPSESPYVFYSVDANHTIEAIFSLRP